MPHSFPQNGTPDKHSAHIFIGLTWLLKGVLYTDREIILMISYIIIPEITNRQRNLRLNTTELEN